MPKVRVAQVSELPPGTLKTYEVEGEHILLANVDGRIYAMGAICSHEEWDLSEGTLEGETVICAGHGAIWNLKTGRAEFSEPLPPLPTYKVAVENDTIYLVVE
ncbi:Benzene 1,2-dioxygenase system ferredoxin subunit [archaeon HR01]|nr:Benzene 1,2-dioxygenase system ferredoxin subunit [archaeon HR01]